MRAIAPRDAPIGLELRVERAGGLVLTELYRDRDAPFARGRGIRAALTEKGWRKAIGGYQGQA